jgi:pyruvate carboxylase
MAAGRRSHNAFADPGEQTVKRGDLLLTIEAMKMETAIHAQRDGIIAEVAVPAGTQVDPKDLLTAYR